MDDVKLNARHKKFADEYLIDLNQTAAYIRAGYKAKGDAAKVNASRLLTHANVQEYIQQRMKQREKRTEITQDRVLQELAAIGFAQATDVAKVISKREEDGTDYQQVEIVDSDQLTVDARAAIAGIKQGANGIEVRMHDKIKALELLGKHLGIYQDNINLKLDPGELTPEQADALIRAYKPDV